MYLRLIFLPSHSIHELLHILGGKKKSSTSFRNPKLICSNERSRPWQCESCLGIPSQLRFGIIKWAVPMSWWFSESLGKSCQRHPPGRAPSCRAPRHPCHPRSGRYVPTSKISSCTTARWTNVVTRHLISSRCSSCRESHFLHCVEESGLALCHRFSSLAGNPISSFPAVQFHVPHEKRCIVNEQSLFSGSYSYWHFWLSACLVTIQICLAEIRTRRVREHAVCCWRRNFLKSKVYPHVTPFLPCVIFGVLLCTNTKYFKLGSVLWVNS